jgi:hypothetical protein
METLNPGATYIYERVGNEVYAREFGADAADRVLVGYGYDPVTGHKIDYDKRTSDGRPLHDHLMESQLWGEIRRAAQTNPTLQDALERAIMIYKLTKTNER